MARPRACRHSRVAGGRVGRVRSFSPLSSATEAADSTSYRFNPRHPLTVPLSTLAIINEVDQNGRLPAGTLAKRVVGGELP
jgi:hypothetical protein